MHDEIQTCFVTLFKMAASLNKSLTSLAAISLHIFLILRCSNFTFANESEDSVVFSAGGGQQKLNVAAAKPTRYLLYDVNSGEGFNLRRDVYMRIANLVKALNEEEPWILVLPPWGRLYHWKSRGLNQIKIPWSSFFDVESLSYHIPVIEYDDYVKVTGEAQIDLIYHLQNYAEGWTDGKWEERIDERDCIDPPSYRKDKENKYRGWFWGYSETYANEFKCLSVQAMAKMMIPVLVQNTSARSVFLDRGEKLLHDWFGGSEYWTARRSLRFAKHLRDIGDEFRRIHLDSTDEKDKTELTDDWREMKKQKVLLVLVDGLRWDQFGYDLPSLRRMEHHGVRADWLDSVFLTYTMPNMYSIATGLYPESHGVIHNQFFNATTGTLNAEYDDVLNITEFFDTGVEPLWVSAKLAGKKVACFMWAGTAVPVKGVWCDRVIHYTSWNCDNYLMKDQVKDAVLLIAEEDFEFVLLALEYPDVSLHMSGTDSDRFHADLLKVDSTLTSLLDDLDHRGLWDTLNLIVVSDHGHATVDPDKFIILTDYIDEDDIEFSVVVNSLFQLKARASAENKVLQQLGSAHPALHVFKKEDFPERFHYGSHPRNLRIIGYVDVGWHVHMKFDPSRDSVYASDHGYDNKKMEMKAIFYARGPAFKSCYRAKPLESKEPGSALGGPYLAAHLRRQDYARNNRKDVPSLENAAKHIIKLLKKHNLKKIFIATDAPNFEIKELKDYLSKYEVHHYVPPKAVLENFMDGGVAIIDQWICAHARYFIGTGTSTFSFRIHEERQILGFDPKMTYNRFCGEGEDKNCDQPSVWNIRW